MVWHPEAKPQHTACKGARPPIPTPWVLPVLLVVEHRHMELTVDPNQVVPGPALCLLLPRLTVPHTVHQRQLVMEHRHLLSQATLIQLQRLMVHPLPMLHRLPVCLLFQPLLLDRAVVLRLHRLGLRHPMVRKAMVLLHSSSEVGLRALMMLYNEHCSCGCLGLPWDWALDFRNVIVEIGPSYRPGSRNPLHFKRGFFDGKRFGYNDIIGESVRAILLDDPSVVEEIPAEYLRPAKADSQGQVVVVIGGGPEQKGQQRTTQYENGGSWMMELEGGDMAPLVVDGADLCRIWKV